MIKTKQTKNPSVSKKNGNKVSEFCKQPCRMLFSFLAIIIVSFFLILFFFQKGITLTDFSAKVEELTSKKTALAATFEVSGFAGGSNGTVGGEDSYAAYDSVRFTASLNKTSYSPGETITVTGVGTPLVSSSGLTPVLSLRATINGSSATNILNMSVSLFRAPQVPGSYVALINGSFTTSGATGYNNNPSGSNSIFIPYTVTSPVTYSCTGTLPANTAVYPGDAVGLTANTAYAYSVANTSAKCQYGCSSGYVRNGTSCVSSPSFKVCEGIINRQTTPFPTFTGYATKQLQAWYGTGTCANHAGDINVTNDSIWNSTNYSAVTITSMFNRAADGRDLNTVYDGQRGYMRVINTTNNAPTYVGAQYTAPSGGVSALLSVTVVTPPGYLPPTDGACAREAVPSLHFSYETKSYASSLFRQCRVGTPSSTAFPAPGATVYYTCRGINGGTDASCSADRYPLPVPGECGSANGKVFASTATGYSPYSQCATGDSNNGSFPARGASISWKCHPSSAVYSAVGPDATCSASRRN